MPTKPEFRSSARLVRDAFDKDRIQVLAGHTVIGVSGGAGHAGTIAVDGPSGTITIEFDQLLVASAAARTPPASNRGPPASNWMTGAS